MVPMICEKDLKMFEAYIDEYVEGTRTVNAEYILRIWQKEKETLFKKIFSENLILSKPIVVTKGEEELVNDMYNKVLDLREFHYFYTILKKIAIKLFKENKYELDSYYDMISLWDAEVLVDNKVGFSKTLNIELPNGKILKVNNGDKPVKVIGKIIKAFYPEEEGTFEKFRIAHSQVLNQKKLRGNLCLSIHPLDYATMSDNTCGWNSCMSWEDDGCYRQGTVEMMNSPMVVVAYLLSDNDMDMPGGGVWNSKKWRELFIINETVISEIKSYPYFNEGLTKECLNWLKELARNAGYGEYSDFLSYNADNRTVSNEEKTSIYFDTGYMYNDFRFTHWLCLNKNANKTSYSFFYSGSSQCMLCGEETGDFSAEGKLGCMHCDEDTVECCECGHLIDLNNDDYYERDGFYYCPECHDIIFVEDGLNGNEIYRDDAVKLGVILTRDNKKYLWNNGSLWISDNSIEYGVDVYFTKEPNYNKRFGMYVIDYEDLTELGQRRFGLDSPDCNDSFFWLFNGYEHVIDSLDRYINLAIKNSSSVKNISCSSFIEFEKDKLLIF